MHVRTPQKDQNNIMRLLFIPRVLALVFFAGNSLAQSESNLEKLEIKNLNLGFCSQPCISGHTKDLDLLLLILKTTASPAMSLEWDSRESKIVYRDASASVEDFKAIVRLIDRSARVARQDPSCKDKRPATVFIGPAESRSN